MQTVTSMRKNPQNTSIYNTFVEKAYYPGQNIPSVEAHKFQAWQTLDMQAKRYQPYNHTQHHKFLSFQTCSTLGTQSDGQECNKENLQMQSPSETNSTIRIQRRSPLKDITSKTLKSSSKMGKSTIQRQLSAYMSSLFPSEKPSPFSQPRKSLRV